MLYTFIYFQYTCIITNNLDYTKMKIVVKHVDNLRSSLIKRKEIPQYLVYKMTEDDTPISCEIANGDWEMNNAIRLIQNNNSVSSSENLTLPICKVSYDEFKNNVLRNETNYVGN